MEETEVVRARYSSGKRFRAVQDADGHVRLWYRRGRNHWIGFKLDFDRPDESQRLSFESRASANKFLTLALTLGGGQGNPRRREVFADEFESETA